MKPIAHGTPREDILCCWPGCFTRTQHPDIPLCESHYREVGLRWISANIDTVREAVLATPAREVVLADAQRRVAIDRLAERPPREPGDESGWIVYYIRMRGSERVKIGTTSNLRLRMETLRADGADLLATEPGGYTVELRRHRQFAEERYGRREEFALSDRLAAHIASLQ